MPTRKQIRDAMRQIIRDTGHHRATEYIDEAEHQDGYSYWDQFASREELLEDFNLYNKCVDETEAEEKAKEVQSH